MSQNYQRIIQLYQSTLKDISNSPQDFVQFLETACYNYKLRFDEQVLIYAQKPEATAVLEISKWNTAYKRWINKGATSIAVFDVEKNGNRLNHYFDIKDTHESYLAKKVPVWDVQSEHLALITEVLLNRFGDFNVSLDFAETIIGAVDTVVEDNIQDYLHVLLNYAGDSLLEELDEQNIKVMFQNLIKNSVSYMVLHRCGYPANEYFTFEDFGDVFYFNNTETFNIIGTATSDISQMTLQEIAKTVRNFTKIHKNKIRTIAKADNKVYTKIKEDETTIKPKGSNNYERKNSIHNARRLQPTEPDSTTNRPANMQWQVRITTQKTSDGEQQSRIHNTIDQWQTERASDGGARTGGTGSRNIHEGTSNSQSHNRGTQGNRPNEMGSPDEQRSQHSRERSDDGTNLLLTDLTERAKPLPTVTEQIDMIEKAGEKSSAFSIETNAKDVPIPVLWAKPKPKKLFDMFPNIPNSERNNYIINDDDLGVGGAKAKYQFNADAIRTLQQIESENRFATSEEQQILSKYVGFGGISQAFNQEDIKWRKEFLELKELLSEDEYDLAKASTLNAHYTSPIVIKAMYQALTNMGFSKGNVLEPACGVGNFFGLVPDEMKESKFYGVELDSITGRLAGQLYQKNSIAVQGFESTNLPDSFFDVAIGNVPFGSFSVPDKKYDKHKFMIHDYFFAKSLDKVRPNGVIAFITSKGTLDKKNPSIRKYIAQRADLIGAIRLPNNAFKANAGTEVTTDIIFLQKRDHIIDIEPEWVHLNQDENTIPMNSYFVDNPDMILGTMEFNDMMYGDKKDTTCTPLEGANLAEQLSIAIQNIKAEIKEYFIDDIDEEIDTTIPADPNVHNFCFTLVDDNVYFRENSIMVPITASETSISRIKGLMNISDCVRTLIEYQTEDYPDDSIKEQQEKLNILYDDFIKKYNRINSRGNSSAFRQDNYYPLLCSLEVFDDENNFKRKADMFSKRTIKAKQTKEKTDTAVEALGVSLGEKACVDIGFMASLMGGSDKADGIIKKLDGIIFKNPLAPHDDMYVGWENSDEYLSGNVRKKLNIALQANEVSKGQFDNNIKALQEVQPKDLDASEIYVKLGTHWMPPTDIKDFIFELLETPNEYRYKIDVHFFKLTAEWNISEKSRDKSINAVQKYGTKRMNAYKIIEETLNSRAVRVFDTVVKDGKDTRVLNKKETEIVQAKQDLIKENFKEWIWKNPKRRHRLCAYYNANYNNIRNRNYDGSHLVFTGMSPDIELIKHQKDVVARIVYGGNTLMAHCVGAGKTFAMIASAMECKRLGLCSKPMFAVPNNIVGQFASEFLQLYPSANILVVTERDMEEKNRQRFCSRISTGDYDGVIFAHSQLIKVPLSIKREKAMLRKQIEDVVYGLQDAKANEAPRYSVKQIEKTKKLLVAKLDKLNKRDEKDDVVTFEQLGIDKIYVDEADLFKNLVLFSKMRNVKGVTQTSSQKATDLFMKTQYLDELTGNKGTVFATGTPISNSLVEMYTMQRYLQLSGLEERGLQHFDAWANMYAETVTEHALKPEGTGLQIVTRLANFNNLPELMSFWCEVTDIKTADMLNLPVPKADYHIVVSPPSEFQKEMVQALAQRAEDCRSGLSKPNEDNMLLITGDGRKLALDQRLSNPMLPDNPDSKVNMCASNVYKIWERSKKDKSAQLVFCDLSTPNNDKKTPVEMHNVDGVYEIKINQFNNVYEDLRNKLIDSGIPENEIAFIHDADSEPKKRKLFNKVRSGDIRVLIGSTSKMGAGTNVQRRLIASHDLDCPWRPRDLEQRLGRTIRQGNTNKQVDIYRYVTEGTFDSYMYQTIEVKQKFISQVMTSKTALRTIADVDEMVLSYAEIKALATGNPHIVEKCKVDAEVSKLNVLKAHHLAERYNYEDKILKAYPQEIKFLNERVEGYQKDILQFTENSKPINGFSPMVINGRTHTEKKSAGTAILECCKSMTSANSKIIGTYCGYEMSISFNTLSKTYELVIINALKHKVDIGMDVHGNITRIDNMLESLKPKLQTCLQKIDSIKNQLEIAKIESVKPFGKEEELQIKTARMKELNELLSADKTDVKVIDDTLDKEPDQPKEKNLGYER